MSALPSGTVSSANFSALTRAPSNWNSCSACCKATVTPCASSQTSAGSTKALPMPSRAITGWQACPPSARVSRTSVLASFAEPSLGLMFNAARKNGSSSR